MSSISYTNFFVLLTMVVALFFILREFFTWYWKQNEIVSKLKKIEGHLEKLSQQNQGKNVPDTKSLDDNDKNNVI
jgi:hypothetical protein